MKTFIRYLFIIVVVTLAGGAVAIVYVLLIRFYQPGEWVFIAFLITEAAIIGGLTWLLLPSQSHASNETRRGTISRSAHLCHPSGSVPAQELQAASPPASRYMSMGNLIFTDSEGALFLIQPGSFAIYNLSDNTPSISTKGEFIGLSNDHNKVLFRIGHPVRTPVINSPSNSATTQTVRLTLEYTAHALHLPTQETWALNQVSSSDFASYNRTAIRSGSHELQIEDLLEPQKNKHMPLADHMTPIMFFRAYLTPYIVVCEEPDDETNGGGEKSMACYNVDTGRRLFWEWGLTHCQDHRIAWSTQQSTLGYGMNRRISIYDLKSGQLNYAMACPSIIEDFSLHPKMRNVIAIATDSSVLVLEASGATNAPSQKVSAGKIVARIEERNATRMVAFSPDGERIACVSGHELSMREVATGKVLRQWSF